MTSADIAKLARSIGHARPQAADHLKLPDQHLPVIGVIRWWQLVFIAIGLPGLLGPAGRDRDIALALIIARVCDETGIPRGDVHIERHEGNRFRVTAPRAFLERLLAQPEVALAEDIARDPLAL